MRLRKVQRFLQALQALQARTSSCQTTTPTSPADTAASTVSSLRRPFRGVMWLEDANHDATVLQCNCVTARLGGQAGHDKNTNTYMQRTDRDPAVTGDKAWYRSTEIPAFQSLSTEQCQEHTRRQQQKRSTH